jgi:hypothetical protein
MAASWYPWLPPIGTAVQAAFEVDEFVVARRQVLPVSSRPGGEPYRFDTGEPDASTHPLVGMPKGGILVVLHGPVVVDDIEWYLLTPAHIAVDVPMGWSPASTPTNEPYIEHRDFACPTAPISTRQLAGLSGLTDGLAACFGNAEITITGELLCDAEPDSYAKGAAWLDGDICRFDTPPSVYGLGPDIRPNTYSVTGHFLDERARDCRPADEDASPMSRVEAIQYCRRAFVATSAEAVRD